MASLRPQDQNAGIADPTKVVVALENAVSVVASALSLTDAAMRDMPEPKKDAAGQEFAG